MKQKIFAIHILSLHKKKISHKLERDKTTKNKNVNPIYLNLKQFQSMHITMDDLHLPILSKLLLSFSPY